ncbi:MAG TPA: L-lactate dehydrogenase [Candidatus Omnitrophota bacterium]|nr:L-lactate dehydrogenase [Candidatus Omnitrophota bacterium]HNQ50464.1 L-lactate dehydrogenase [Candidatus Omnitrophota bacterium]HQO37740.1 L-lactate dehydrogenase [Candidatus Omnitrophota bacterium]HQQ05731.1 L-lactate dehydrogenase [Candidatus Omnitrophota bacterium]
METLKPKISIIGCGNVGMRYAYAAMIQGLARQIVIVDLDRKRLEGEVMDLSHGAPYISPVDVRAGEYADIKDSDLVVITAGKKQLPGQTRIDLVRDNVAIYRAMIPEIVKHAPGAILLVVTNPVDVLAYAAYKISGKPAGQVMSSGTVLDSARFRFLLSKHCKVDPRNIHAYILGEHGDTEFAVWSKAMIGGVLLKEYCTVCAHRASCDRQFAFGQIYNEVRTSAYQIIERKGETSYGIGLALVRITRAILNDENAILPVSNLVNGYLGVSDVYLSLPAIVNKSGVRQVLNLDLDETEQAAFRNSAGALKKVIQEAGLQEPV